MDEGKIIKLDSPDKMIDELLAGGFEKPKQAKAANMEYVFIYLTSHNMRDE